MTKEEFKKESFSELGITNHPMADKAFELAEYYSVDRNDFDDVFEILKELSEIMSIFWHNIGTVFWTNIF